MHVSSFERMYFIRWRPAKTPDFLVRIVSMTLLVPTLRHCAVGDKLELAHWTIFRQQLSRYYTARTLIVEIKHSRKCSLEDGLTPLSNAGMQRCVLQWWLEDTLISVKTYDRGCTHGRSESLPRDSQIAMNNDKKLAKSFATTHPHFEIACERACLLFAEEKLY